MKKLLLLFGVLLVSIGMRAEITYSVTPENETKLETVPDNVIFTFSESVTVANAYISLGRGMSKEVTDDLATKTGTEIVVPMASMKEQILANGFFMVSLMDESSNQFAMAQYEIVIPMNTLENKKIVPENNAIVENLSVITLTYGVAGTGLGNMGVSIGGIDKTKEKVQLYQRLNPNPVATGTITVSDDYMDIIVTLDKSITESGVYNLTIPEATVFDDQADLTDDNYIDVESSYTQDNATYNPQVTLTYLVKAPQNTLSLKNTTPEDNATVESLSVITLTYGKEGTSMADPGISISGIDASKKNVQLLDKNKAVAANGVISVVDELSVKITFDTPITSEGVYTLTIPEATVYDDNAELSDWDNFYVDVESSLTQETATYNPEVTLTYTVSSSLTYTITPNNEEKLSEVPDNVVFTFSKSVTITEAYVILDRGNSTEVTDQIAAKTGTEITVPIPAALKEQILANGFFMVSLNGENDLSAMAEYEMIVPLNTLELQKAEPDNNSSVESLNVITLTYGIEGTGWSNPGIGISGIDKTKENVERKYADNAVAATGKITLSEDQLSLVVTLDETVTASGIYTLTIPEATVYDDQAELKDGYVDVNSDFTKEATYNPEVTLTYTISPAGISMVQTIPAGEVNVYSVQGILLRKGDTTVVLNGLAEGIYIVNGQKVIISK